MEIRQIQTFVQAARLESFSKAAEMLGYSQSAVTVQIRLLPLLRSRPVSVAPANLFLYGPYVQEAAGLSCGLLSVRYNSVS